MMRMRLTSGFGPYLQEARGHVPSLMGTSSLKAKKQDQIKKMAIYYILRSVMERAPSIFLEIK